MKARKDSRIAAGGPRRRQTAGDRGHELPSSSRAYTATQAKNEFGRVLDAALQGVTVVITKHHAPRAVLISVDKFTALQQAPQLKLDTLSAEFDALLSRMHTAVVRAGMERAFAATPERIGKAAVRAARKHG